MNASKHQSLISHAGSWTVGDLISREAQRNPTAPALEDASRTVSFSELVITTSRIANLLYELNVSRGERIAILSENSIEYVEIVIAAAKIGVIVSVLNWRLSETELHHCITLVSPKIIFTSERFDQKLANFNNEPWLIIKIDSDLEKAVQKSRPMAPPVDLDPEDGFIIVYTSGTTGLPKGALISHRAELARSLVSRLDVGLERGDTFVAWPPMFHMVSIEHALHTLFVGGKVIIVDGADTSRLADLIASEPQWWLVLIPGMIEELAAEVKRRHVKPKNIKVIGALADLVSPTLIGEISGLLNAPYWNTFGSTETGMLPVAGTRFPIGGYPNDLSKQHNSLYLWKLTSPDGQPVGKGGVGEMTVRGPTVFSGYWNAPEVNEKEFRDGWFHMGDMFIENDDGTFSYADRIKYMIKSGGENIYPAEIERTLLKDPAVAEAVVVRKKHEKWGEVPVAYIAVRGTDIPDVDRLVRLCKDRMADYKCPHEFFFVKAEDFPRSTSGKVQRGTVELWSRGKDDG